MSRLAFSLYLHIIPFLWKFKQHIQIFFPTCRSHWVNYFYKLSNSKALKIISTIRRILSFCQAQPKLQVQLEAELDLISMLKRWKMTILAWNQQNLLSNLCRSTLVDSKTILKRWKMAIMEDDINGRYP